MIIVAVVVGDNTMVDSKDVACLDDGPQRLALVCCYSNKPPFVPAAAAAAAVVVADLSPPAPSSSVAAAVVVAALPSPPYSVDLVPLLPWQHSISPSLANPVQWHVANRMDLRCHWDVELRIGPPRVMPTWPRGLDEIAA